jgi:hypothetical protein
VQKVWAEMGRASAELATVELEWRGFTATRNLSLGWVFTPWVLWIDADEWVSPELARDVRQVVEAPLSDTTPDIYRMPRQSYFLGRPIRHGGWYPDRKLRLGRREFCAWSSGPNASDVHEDLRSTRASTQEPGLLRGHIEHEPFRDTNEQHETNERYSGLLARGLARKWLEQKRRPPGRFYIALKTAVKFIENYFWKGGWLDGRPGFLIAQGSSKSLWMRLHKARSLMLKQRSS